jgi:hypothetical protein
MNINELVDSDNLIIVLGIMLLLLSLLLIAVILVFIKSRVLKKKYDIFMGGFYEGKNFEEIFETLLTQVKYQEKKSIDLAKRIAVIEKNIRYSLQKTGIIRYKAFDGKGGDQSFSLSLLDQNDNGFVVTNIYNDGLSSVYGKEIKGGRSDHRLSPEEISVVEKAKEFFKDNTI